MPTPRSNLGVMYAEGRGVPQDYSKGCDLVSPLRPTKATRWPRPTSAPCTKEAKAFPQDYSEAVKWFRVAADQGYATAQTQLGHKYFLGRRRPAKLLERL